MKLLLPLLVTLILINPAPATAASCLDANCHGKLAKGKFVHGPVGSGDCDTCHKPKVKGFKAKQHRRKGEMSVPSKTRGICLECHDGIKEQMEAKYHHKPMTKVDCIFCHDPHSSSLRYMLRPNRRVSSKGSYCFSCHKKQGFEGKVKHKPVAKGSCGSCHLVHGAKQPKLLAQPLVKLCQRCHKMPWQKRKVVHGPVASGMCEACHKPHASNNTKLLVRAQKALCLGCHDEKGITSRHAAVKGFTKSCSSCHEPHATNKAHLLK